MPNTLVPCLHGMAFSGLAEHGATLVSEFELVCSQGAEILVPLTGTVVSVGQLVGALALAPLVERFGRVRLLVASLAMSAAFSCGAALAPSVHVFCAMRFGAGVFQQVSFRASSLELAGSGCQTEEMRAKPIDSASASE